MNSVSNEPLTILDSLKTTNYDADIKSALDTEPSSGFFSSIPWYVWLILVLVLIFLVFNLLLYLAKGQNNFFAQILDKIKTLFGSQQPEVAAPPVNEEPHDEPAIENTSAKDLAQQTALYNALNNTNPEEPKSDPTDYSADDSYSSIQKTKSSSKSGWCYIGEDRGFRSCINVGEADQCMSGNIFPSEDICINPSLRA